jgi:hypothetical protein
VVITPKSVYLLTMDRFNRGSVYLLIMDRFNRGLVLNKFFMDRIKYGWNILSSHTK